MSQYARSEPIISSEQEAYHQDNAYNQDNAHAPNNGATAWDDGVYGASASAESPGTARTAEPAGTAGTAEPAGTAGTAESPHMAGTVGTLEVHTLLRDPTGYRRQWESIQVGFVDDPRGAVGEADKLVSSVIDDLVSGFREQRGGLEKQWSGGGEPSTDALRRAFQQYRDFFDRLLQV